MIDWFREKTEVSSEGTTVTYAATNAPMRIKSRKRHIPHANRSGTWDHTTFHVFWYGEEVAVKYTLKDAKAFAEEYMKEDHNGNSL